MHYKGARGSWRMQHLIKDFDQKAAAASGAADAVSVFGLGLGAEGTSPPTVMSLSAPDGPSSGSLASAAGAGRAVSASNNPSPSDVSQQAESSNSGSSCECASGIDGGLAVSPPGSSPLSDTSSPRLALVEVSTGPLCSPPARPSPEDEDSGCEETCAAAVLRIGAASDERQQRQSEAESADAGGGGKSNQGLRYLALAELSPFVQALLEDGGGDVLSEDAVVRLLLLLPERHRAEVGRHVAELKRRHVRQQRGCMRRTSVAATTQELSALK